MENYLQNELASKLSNVAEGFGSILGKAFQTADGKIDSLGKDWFKSAKALTPYKFDVTDGIIKVEVVVTGHKPEDIKVRYNKKSHVLHITDESTEPKDKPWYYSTLDLEFELPETTIKENFIKHIENGLLSITTDYTVDYNSNENEVLTL